jgi:hypothetical protein
MTPERCCRTIGMNALVRAIRPKTLVWNWRWAWSVVVASSGPDWKYPALLIRASTRPNWDFASSPTATLLRYALRVAAPQSERARRHLLPPTRASSPTRSPPAALHWQTLFSDEHVCVVCEDHPVTGDRFELDDSSRVGVGRSRRSARARPSRRRAPRLHISFRRPAVDGRGHIGNKLEI